METDSPKYYWLNRVDFIAPGAFNGTEIMTVNHYFPNVSLRGTNRRLKLTYLPLNSLITYLMVCLSQLTTRLRRGIFSLATRIIRLRSFCRLYSLFTMVYVTELAEILL